MRDVRSIVKSRGFILLAGLAAIALIALADRSMANGIPLALAAVALIVPHTSSFLVLLTTRALCFAILAMSVDLLLGFTGLSSMGQAAYFGVGAYLTAILAAKYHVGLGWDFWLVCFWECCSARHWRRCSGCSRCAPAASIS